MYWLQLINASSFKTEISKAQIPLLRREIENVIVIESENFLIIIISICVALQRVISIVKYFYLAFSIFFLNTVLVSVK